MWKDRTAIYKCKHSLFIHKKNDWSLKLTWEFDEDGMMRLPLCLSRWTQYLLHGSPLECISKGTLFRFDISLSSSLYHHRDTERTWWDLKIAYVSCRSSGAHCSGRYPGKSCRTCAEHNLICHRWWDKTQIPASKALVSAWSHLGMEGNFPIALP